MSDIISTLPVSIRQPDLPRLGLRGIGVDKALGAIAGLLGQAFNSAYVDPYTSLQRRPPAIPEDDLEGRDCCALTQRPRTGSRASSL